MLGCDFDAAITGSGDQFLIGMGKQKQADAKENSHGRYCDNAERAEVEQGADIGLQRPGALIRGIGERTRCFGRLWRRVSGCTSRRELPRQLVERLLSEHSAVHLASPFRSTSQNTIGDWRPEGSRSRHRTRELPASVLAD
jgi:hypothetical protein